MQICMLIYNYWPEKTGGAEKQCRLLAEQLITHGKKVIVVTALQSSNVAIEENYRDVKIIRLPIFETFISSVLSRKKSNSNLHPLRNEATQNDVAENGLGPRRVNSLRQLLSKTVAACIKYLNVLVFSFSFIFYLFRRKRGVSVIHVHTADWIAGVAAIAGKIFNIKVLCKGTNAPVFPPLKNVPFPRLLDKWRKKPYFIALTKAMAADYYENNVSKDMVTVIPNGVMVPDRVTNVSANNTFLCVGNFSQTAAHKGFDILLKCWAIVVSKVPNAHMILVGGGDSSEWQTMSDELGIKDNVLFPGYSAAIETYYLQSCCFLLPSRKEGISNALLEAQSYGLPAIVSDIPGNREVVVQGTTGFIVPVGDSVAMAEKVIECIHSPELRNKLGEAARNNIIERFSMEVVSVKIGNLYKKIVG